MSIIETQSIHRIYPNGERVYPTPQPPPRSIREGEILSARRAFDDNLNLPYNNFSVVRNYAHN